MGAIKILFLEDNVDDCTAFVRVIEKVYKDYLSIHWAKTYEEAIDLYTNDEFDGLLVDLDLRGSYRQGEDFIKEIRANNPDIIIDILTGIDYEGLPPDHKFKERFNVRQWYKKPLFAGDFCHDLCKHFGLEIDF